ncbi:DUF2461 domain-containing protein [uncultured Sanguibacteroides sp.]|uniref:DUF2461 domain-containing protein n=1 Tax=uncultured Sanguibacteroides sp. TaxID=1635151 RepID=UPI0025EA95E8|nr:DUF2461 domain-containing protein [uncultured Sanguibacteroides sp.]
MKEILHFLSDLKENNNREWFQANKSRYLKIKVLHEEFIGELIREIAKFDPEIDGLAVKDCIFRIYRDTRFATDKTPYKTHIGAFMARGGKMDPRGGYYVHIEPGGSLFAGGIWCPPPAMLKALRQDVYDNIEEFTSIIREPEFAKYYYMDGEKLKKVPLPFPKDFPEGELLKYKNYTVTNDVSDAFWEGDHLVERCAERLKLLLPFNRFLNYTVDESMQGGRIPQVF